MTSLRLFICRDACLSGEPNFLSNQLRLIDWEGYPGEYFPPNFRGKYLVILRMAHSRIKILDGVQQFQNLTTMKFYDCVFLEKIPDVSRIPNLESLALFNCENLVEVHHSVGSLNKLNNLTISFCSNLRSFPKSFKSRSLEEIYFQNFSMLKNFPKMECVEDIYCCDSLRALDWGSTFTLYELNLSGSGIVTLSRCIESFVGMKFLSLIGCEQLREILGLPPNVEEVSASGCLSLEIFLEGSRKSLLFNTEDPPERMGVGTEIPAQQSLRKIDLSYSGIVSLPIWFNKFVKLEELHLNNCKRLRKILVLPPNVRKVEAPNCSSLEVFLGEAGRSQFNTFVPPNPLWVGTASSALQPLEQKFQLECPFNSLEFLDLSGSAIVSLPIWFNKFVKLEYLRLRNCKQLRKILVLPPNVREVQAPNCSQLEVFLGEARRSQLFNTFVPPNPLWVGTESSALQPLEQKFQLECSFNSLKCLELSGSAMVSLPIWFNKFVKLERLHLRNCKQLRKILVLPPNVRKVEAPNCSSLEVFLGEAGRSQLFNTVVPPNLLWNGTASSALQPLEQKFQLECSFNSLKRLELSGSAIVSLPIWFNKFVKLGELNLSNCKQLRKILVLPPNVREVYAPGCSSLEVFLGEAGRSQLFNTVVPPNLLWNGTASSALQPLEQKFQLECSFNSLERLDLSRSAIVSLPIWFNKFVKLEKLRLKYCKQLQEVPELPRNIRSVDLGGCTSLERFPFNNFPKLWWMDFSYCPEQIGNAVHNHLFSEGHPKVGGFKCIYPGNRIPDCFSYYKEVSNTNLCEIDTGPLHFDSKNTIFAFSAVIGPMDDGKDQSTFVIDFRVFNNGQEIRSYGALMINQITRPDHVLLIYESYHSQLTTNNLRVKFEIEPPPLVFFKSCAFHIIEQGYDDDDYDDDDDDDDYDDDDDDEDYAYDSDYDDDDEDYAYDSDYDDDCWIGPLTISSENQMVSEPGSWVRVAGASC
ncbi:protein SUPPRESSOR OF npr1-1, CONSTITUTIVE 1-like [Corylus avellana]|uniref:protein SUPPRESSOR OF npr1-1, CONSTITUTIVE 1-like n=1 Tax=Corylus avellana TaxID=13451 RepID=UPI00286B3607|nr:protein SUPPRESSOR OF npr1-1, CONSTITUTIVE 1-like [Corylus avellana]XP_059454152.1 protein SUPPRESSOR OF npr1-1, CONSTITUTIVE 1-like [Corylus avellana]XP_059454153.1 protein SUPPRESSOR OF npr1-1, CONSTITUTIVE 1-like [Corylus avellana]